MKSRVFLTAVYGLLVCSGAQLYGATSSSSGSIRVLKGPETLGRAPAYSVSFNKDGSLLASNHENWVRLWDVANGRYAVDLKGHLGLVTSVSFNKHSNLIASGSLDKTIRLWDGKEKRSLGVLGEHNSDVKSVIFSADGKTLASSSLDKTVRLWDVETKKEIVRLDGYEWPITPIAFSTDGKLLASGNGSVIWLSN